MKQIFCLFLLMGSLVASAQNEMNPVIQHQDIPFMRAPNQENDRATFHYADRKWDCGLMNEVVETQWFGPDTVVMHLKCIEKKQAENPPGSLINFIATLTSTASGLQLTEWVDGGSAHSNYEMTCGVYDYEMHDGRDMPQIFKQMNEVIQGRQLDGVGRRSDSFDILKLGETDKIGFRLIDERDRQVAETSALSPKLVVDCGLVSTSNEFSLPGNIRNAITHVRLDPIDANGDLIIGEDSSDSNGEDGGPNRMMCSYSPARVAGRSSTPEKFVCTSANGQQVTIHPVELKMPWSANRTDAQGRADYEFQCYETGHELRIEATWFAKVIKKVFEQDITFVRDLLELEDMLEENPDAHLDTDGYYALGSKRTIFPEEGGHKEFIAFVGPVKLEHDFNFTDILHEGYQAQDPLSIDVKKVLLDKLLNTTVVITARGCLLAPEKDFDNLQEQIIVENSINQWNYARNSWGYAEVKFSGN